MHRKLTNALMKWLENTVKLCLLLTILHIESFVETGVRDLINIWQVNANIFKVMGKAFLRDFFLYVVICSATKNKETR